MILQKSIRTSVSYRYLNQKNEVFSGLFKGMKLPDAVSHQNYTLAHMLGVYETQVQSMIADHIDGHKRFIDIGCGSGFFTVGVPYALNIPSMGFDQDEVQIDYANELAAINKLADKIDHKVVKTDGNYNHHLQEGDFCLVDIEGGELDLIQSIDPALRSHVTWLIEIHEIDGQSVDEVLRHLMKIFKNTHDHEIIGEEFYLDFDSVETLGGLTRNDYVFLSNNQRSYHQKWILFKSI